MKRTFALSLLVVIGLLAGAFLKLVFDDTLNSGDISTVVLYKDEEAVYTFDESDFELWSTWINAVRLMEPATEHNARDFDYKIVVSLGDSKGDEKEIVQELSVDFDTGTVGIRSDDKEVSVDFSLPIVASFVSHQAMRPYYPDYTAPNLVLTYGDLTVEPYRLKEQWTYRLVNGQYVSSEAREQETTYFETLTVSEKQSVKVMESGTHGTIEVRAVTSDGVVAIELSEDGTFVPLVSDEAVDYQLMLIYPENDLGLPVGEIAYDMSIYVHVSPKVHLSDMNLTQGGLLRVQIENIKPDQTVEFDQTIVDEVIQYRIDRTVYAMIPFIYWVEDGQYPFIIKLGDGEQTSVIYDSVIHVTDRAFSVQNLTVDTTVAAATRNDDAYTEYHAEFMPVRQTSHDEQLWDGPFIQPIEGRLTTDYGTRRRVNGELTSYRHNGIDLAAPTGTPVKASNSGKVVFSKKLILTGNTVMIDHGLGLFTYYLHMDKRHVSVGDFVEKADIIGEVGSTGFSTGPHLHFTVSYHLTNINPLTFLEWDGEWPN